MGFLELTFYDLCRNKFGEDLGNFILENWRRFLNDCETLLEENKINPNDILSILNSINQSIQLTTEYTKRCHSFPGMLIKRNNESSNHTNHCKRDVHFALAHLICTIVENTEAKMKHLENLKMNLSKFQYSKQLIECCIKRALSIPLQELRTPKTI